jgi:hypothetical protein
MMVVMLVVVVAVVWYCKDAQNRAGFVNYPHG